MRWSQEQLDWLGLNYPKRGTEECANALGTTRASVRMKASRMGLRLIWDEERYSSMGRKSGAARIGKKATLEHVTASKAGWEKLRASGWKKPALTDDHKRRIGVANLERAKRRSESPELAAAHAKAMHNVWHDPATNRRRSASTMLAYAKMPRWKNRLRTERVLKTKMKRYGTLQTPRANCTWKQGWREIGGKRIYARSAWEANYARYLEFLKVHGEIAEWEHEPETIWFEGIKRGTNNYTPDFRVQCKKGIEYHEVKGWMDAKSKTKIRRMRKYHPDKKLVVLDSKWFRLNSRKLSGLIKGWE